MGADARIPNDLHDACYAGPPRPWLFGNIPETLKEGGIYR